MLFLTFIAGFELHTLGLERGVAKKQHIMGTCSVWDFDNYLIHNIVIILYLEFLVN